MQRRIGQRQVVNPRRPAEAHAIEYTGDIFAGLRHPQFREKIRIRVEQPAAVGDENMAAYPRVNQVRVW